MLFLLYNATFPSCAVVEHLFIVVETDWLAKHSVIELLHKQNQAC